MVRISVSSTLSRCFTFQWIHVGSFSSCFGGVMFIRSKYTQIYRVRTNQNRSVKFVLSKLKSEGEKKETSNIIL